MNAKQKAARLIGIVLLAIATLFPPWKLILKKDGVTESSSLGYHPLWNPPFPEIEAEDREIEANFRIDLIRLGIQLGVILVVVNGAVFLLKTKEQPGDPS
ncbi:MAG: hypothetical protein HY735_00170 [Verrucomicrobia bacterium]|nr:hypothetical protein [Verrucomicrobiota bacterium]